MPYPTKVCSGLPHPTRQESLCTGTTAAWLNGTALRAERLRSPGGFIARENDKQQRSARRDAVPVMLESSGRRERACRRGL